jgi:hypothetical protein
VTMPLILQIQNAAVSADTPLTDVLRRAKLACGKLKLTAFGGWIDAELNGYSGVSRGLARLSEANRYARSH